MLRVCTVGVFFFVRVKYQRIVHNIPTSRIFFKEPRGGTPLDPPGSTLESNNSRSRGRDSNFAFVCKILLREKTM